MTPEMEYLFEAVKTLVTWVLVIGGWLVVSDQQGARELGKNTYVRLSDLRGDLVEIENLAITHHTTMFTEANVKSLLRAIGDFSTEMSHFKKCGFVGLATTMEVTTLRQAITGKNMDASSYVKQHLTCALIAGIEEARSSLDRDLIAASHKALSKPRTLRESLSNSIKQRL